MPDVPRGADGCALEPAGGWCRSSAFKIFQRSDAEASIHAAAGCPHAERAPGGAPPAPPACLSRAKMAERTGDDCHGIERSTSRRAQAWPLGKGSTVGKTRELRLVGAGRTTRSSGCSSFVPSWERRTGANKRQLPVQLVLAAHNCPSKSATASTKQKVRVRRYACKRVISRCWEASRPTICNL